MTAPILSPLFCQALLNDGEQCTCESYYSPARVVEGEKELCRECLHGRSKHPIRVEPQATEPLASKASVLSLFKCTSAVSEAGPSSHTEARAEMLSGLKKIDASQKVTLARAVKPLKVSISFLEKDLILTLSNSAQSKPKNNPVEFYVFSIIVLCCGMTVSTITLHLFPSLIHSRNRKVE